MKQLLALTASALCVAMGALTTSCSSSDDDPIDQYPNHIGLSVPVLYFDAGGSEHEIDTKSDGWTLSEVVMTECANVYDDFVVLWAMGTVYDSQFYQPELKADKPFEFTANKMTFSYSDKKIKINAGSRDASHGDHQFLYEFILKKGDSIETVYCQHTLTFVDPSAIVATPQNLTIPAEGGTFTIDIALNYGFKGWKLNSLSAYGGAGQLFTGTVKINPGDTWSQEFLWFTLEADGPESLRVIVQPNVHGDVRDFKFDLGTANNRVTITGTQAK